MEGVFAILKLPDLFGHIIAFLILFFWLKHWFWGAILQEVDLRSDSIELAYTEIEKKQAEAEHLNTKLIERLTTIEEERRQVLEEAAKQGKNLAEEIRQAAETQRERLLEKAYADITMERDKLKVEMNNYAADLSVNIAGKLIKKQLDREEQLRLARDLMASL